MSVNMEKVMAALEKRKLQQPQIQWGKITERVKDINIQELHRFTKIDKNTNKLKPKDSSMRSISIKITKGCVGFHHPHFINH